MKGKLKGKLKKFMISKKDKRERTMEEKKVEKQNMEKTKKEVINSSLPLFGCGGRTNELDITAEIIRYILYTLLYIRIHLTNYVSY